MRKKNADYFLWCLHCSKIRSEIIFFKCEWGMHKKMKIRDLKKYIPTHNTHSTYFSTNPKNVSFNSFRPYLNIFQLHTCINFLCHAYTHAPVVALCCSVHPSYMWLRFRSLCLLRMHIFYWNLVYRYTIRIHSWVRSKSFSQIYAPWT